MSTDSTAAASGTATAAAHQVSVMDVDPPIHAAAAARSRDIAGQAATADSIRTLNGLAPGSAITDAHRDVWAKTLRNKWPNSPALSDTVK